MAAESPGSAGPLLWVSYQEPDPWVAPTGNVHFYVTTPTVTTGAVGSRSMIEVTVGSQIDCANLGAGFHTADGWVNANFTVEQCAGNKLTAWLPITSQMVGEKVFLVGWTQTGGTWVKLDARVGHGSDLTQRSATATATPQRQQLLPDAPASTLGTWQGRTVEMASQATVNEVWVDRAVRHQAPSGEVVRAVLQDGQVHALIKVEEKTYVLWHLDLATSKDSQQVFEGGSLVEAAGPGFMIDHPATAVNPPTRVAYSWDGESRYSSSWRPYRMAGFTKNYLLVIEGGMTSSGLHLQSMVDGGTSYDSAGGNMVTDVKWSGDSDVVTYREPGGSADQLCEFSPSGTSCTAAPQ